MAPGTTKYDVLENKPQEIGDLIDHQTLLKTVQSLAAKIEAMESKELSDSSIENHASVLGSKNLSQSPLLDQLLDELQKLKISTRSSLPAVDQCSRLAGIEETLVHVMANVGYDILTAVQDVQSKIAVLAEAHQPAEPAQLPHAVFTVDSQHSKQVNIIKYKNFLCQIPRCEGECCSTSMESTDLKVPGYCCQHAGLLDKKIHFACPVPLYELCPIEVMFKRFEYESSMGVIINFAAATSYTNFVSSVFIPNRDDPVTVQIPWMSNMQNIHVLGKVAAEIQFSTKNCLPITFQMNVIDWTDEGNRVVIFGRDFVDKYVQSVHHDSHTVILKNVFEAEKTFEKKFIYVANVLRDIEAKFCRFRLKKEMKDVEEVQAQINRLQRVLILHTPTSDDQISENQTKELKAAINDPSAEISALKPNSEPQNIEKDTLKSCDEVKDARDDLKSSLQFKNMQQQQIFLENFFLKDAMKGNLVSNLHSKVEEKEEICYLTVAKNQQEEHLKLSSPPKISQKDVSVPITTMQVIERKANKTTVESQNLDVFKDTSSQSRNMEKEIPTTNIVSSVSENQKVESLTVMLSSSLCHRKVVVREKNKPSSVPEMSEKQKLEHNVQNVVEKKDTSKQSVLIPVSVMKKQIQENQSAKSGSEEPTLKSMKVKTVRPQKVDEGLKTKV